MQTGRRVLGFSPRDETRQFNVRAQWGKFHVAKTATAKKPEKEQPVDNPEALARYAAERNRPRLAAPSGLGITKRTKNLEDLFLSELSLGYSVTASAWVIGVHRSTAYQWRADSEATLQEDGSYRDTFCQRWDSAVEAGTDKLEDEARRRAERGIERPVYQGGVMVGTITEYSDTLMATLLKGNRPGKFNTERHELTGKNGAPIAHSMEIEFIDSKGKK